MDGLRFPVAVHLNGTLAANATGAFALPIGMTLESVQVCGSNENDARLTVGTSADADGILKSGAAGESSIPKVFGKSAFDGALCDAVNPPHFAGGTIFTWTLDFDGAGGAAAADVDILFSFLEG